jgi:HD-GYP domain-containing protein (c-di-GMP phosphodiesterase class II)
MTNPATLPLESGDFDPQLREEIGAVFWIFEEVRERRPLPVLEAEAVTHALYVYARREGQMHVPQLPLHHMSEYHAVHAISVAVLAMGAAELMDYEEKAVRAIGLAGLLHDIGMVRVPVEMLAKTESLSDEERKPITRHPVEGATIITEADANLDLAAVVALEHHLKPDGSGYPKMIFPRQPHRVSSLIGVCDTYHALRSPRPFREAWPTEIVFSYLHQRAGFDFEREAVLALSNLIRPPML